MMDDPLLHGQLVTLRNHVAELNRKTQETHDHIKKIRPEKKAKWIGVVCIVNLVLEICILLKLFL